MAVATNSVVDPINEYEELISSTNEQQIKEMNQVETKGHTDGK